MTRADADRLDALARVERDTLNALQKLLAELAIEHRGVRLRYIPRATWQMGDPFGEPDEIVRTVETPGFFLSETVLCFGDGVSLEQLSDRHQARDLYRINPLGQQRVDELPLSERVPMVGATFTAASSVARSLGLRLPSEEEWERACRGCTTEENAPPWGDPGVLDDELDAICVHRERKLGAPRRFKPNDYGVFGMLGGVWEWCADDYDAKHKIIRGGSYIDDRAIFRPAFRGSLAIGAISSVVGVRFAMDAG